MRVRACLTFLIITGLFGPPLLSAAQKAEARAMRVKVTAEQANLREKPDIGSTILQQIPEGSILEADRKDGEWYFVRYTLEDGGVIGGWLHESLVEPVEAEAEAAAPVVAAPVEAPVERPAVAVSPERGRPSEVGLPLEISVSAGLATLAPRDLNDGAKGYPDWYGATIGVAAPEPVGILHAGPAAEIELAYRLSPRISLGLGAGYIHAVNATEMTLAGELATETVRTRPSLRTSAVKATVRFYPGAGIYVRGALGLYSVTAGYLWRHAGDGAWEESKGSATATGLGAEAAFGGEWAAGKRTSFFVEAGLRMAAVDNLSGKNTDSSAEGSETETGTLYFFHRTAPDERAYAAIVVHAGEPAGLDIVNPQPAEINISGISLRVGLRYRF
jgi:hypothetical protein